MEKVYRTRAVVNENAATKQKLVTAKLKQGPTLQRAALGDVGNRPGIRKPLGTLGLKKTLRKNEGTSNLCEKLPKNDKENIDPKALEEVKNVIDIKDKSSENETKRSSTSSMEICKSDEESTSYSSARIKVIDIDEEDYDNPQLVACFVKNIYKYLHDLEEAHPVEPKYLKGQSITYKMRGVLIDWLIQVHLKFSLLQETLYLTVAIIDRFLQKDRTITKDRLQLVGVTAMLIASKYEEMYIPEVRDFSIITDKAFSVGEILKMEVHILRTVNCYISYPLPLHFLRRNSKAGEVDGKQHTIAKFLMELTLPEYTFCSYKPSLIAAAAIFLSLRLTSAKDDVWNDTIAYYSTYSEKELMSTVCQMSALVIRSASAKDQQAIRNKYKSPKFLGIVDNVEGLKPSSRILRSYASRIVSVSKTPKPSLIPALHR